MSIDEPSDGCALLLQCTGSVLSCDSLLRESSFVRRLAMALAALAVGCSSGRAADQPSPAEAVPVVVATVERKDVPEEVPAVGTVQARESVGLRARVAGTLQSVHFADGQEVSRGQLLFVIDPRPFQSALDGARARLARDQAQATYATREEARYRELFGRGLVSAELYQQARSNAASLRATLRSDRAAVRDARLQLAYCYLHSPLDGRIGRRQLDPGNLVRADTDTLAVINRVRPIFVSFALPEQFLPEVRRRLALRPLAVRATPRPRRGQQDAMHAAEASLGHLDFVDNAVDAATGTIALRATFPNTNERLWPGEFSDVMLVLGHQRDALVVPAQAVETGQQGSFVYLVKPDSTVERRAVRLGMRHGGEIVIAAGVAAGDRVVTDGQLRLVPGRRVDIRPAPSAGPSTVSAASREALP